MYTKVYARLMDPCMHRPHFKAHDNASASHLRCGHIRHIAGQRHRHQQRYHPNHHHNKHITVPSLVLRQFVRVRTRRLCNVCSYKQLACSIVHACMVWRSYWGFVARYYTNSYAADVTSICPENCRDHGTCVAGKCICDPGTIFPFSEPNLVQTVTQYVYLRVHL